MYLSYPCHESIPFIVALDWSSSVGIKESVLIYSMKLDNLYNEFFAGWRILLECCLS